MKKGFLLLLYPCLCFCTEIDLKIGARPQGMGGAFVGVSDDSNAIYWNPAGLCLISSGEVSFMHANPFSCENTYIDWASIAQPFRRSSGVGIGLLYKSAVLEEGRENNKSRMSDSCFIISGASSIGNSVMYGVSIKMFSLSSKLEKEKGMGFDIGLLYKGDFPISGFSCGFMYRNLASSIKDEEFPKEIRFGISKRFFDERLILSSDCSVKRDVNKKEEDIRWYNGFELMALKNIFLRLGYDNGDIGCGLGTIIKRYCIDYSFLKEEEYGLPDTHRFALSIRF
ncbi:MAG: PorV/PorQ family protein [bacterium]